VLRELLDAASEIPFQDRLPDIELASELEKELRIRALVESSSFAWTHAVRMGQMADAAWQAGT
jgi:hypothetical protein